MIIDPYVAIFASAADPGSDAEPASDAPLIQSAVWSAAGLNPLREPVRPL